MSEQAGASHFTRINQITNKQSLNDAAGPAGMFSANGIIVEEDNENNTISTAAG